MRFRIIPSTADGRHQLLTSYLINDTLAIDDGSLAIGLTTREQLEIGSIVITHAHLDHVISLPLYLTNLLEELRKPVKIYATLSDYEAISEHLFSPRVWITLAMMKNASTELIDYHPFKTGESFIAEGVEITPIPVSHTILTHGLLIEDKRTALLFTSDTKATDHIWQVARDCGKLRAVFIDVSFPSRLTELARVSCHHSTATLLEELPKIKSEVEVYAIHLKAAYHEEIEAEISALNNPRIKVAQIGQQYEF